MLIWAGKVMMVCINDEIEGYLRALEVITDNVSVCQELKEEERILLRSWAEKASEGALENIPIQ